MKFATFLYFFVLAFVTDAVRIDLNKYYNTAPLGPPVGIMIEEVPALYPPFEDEEPHQFNFDTQLGYNEYNKAEYIPKPKIPGQ